MNSYSRDALFPKYDIFCGLGIISLEFVAVISVHFLSKKESKLKVFH